MADGKVVSAAGRYGDGVADFGRPSAGGVRDAGGTGGDGVGSTGHGVVPGARAAALVPVADGGLDRGEAGHAAGGEVSPVLLDPLHVPVLVGVFLDAWVVRNGDAVDERRGVVAVSLDEGRGQPPVHERHGDLLLRLRLHEEVTVRVEAGGIAARAVHPAVGVVVHEDDDDLVVEDLVDRGIDTPRASP